MRLILGSAIVFFHGHIIFIQNIPKAIHHVEELGRQAARAKLGAHVELLVGEFGLDFNGRVKVNQSKLPTNSNHVHHFQIAVNEVF